MARPASKIIIAAFDGACKANGRASAHAGFGMVVIDSARTLLAEDSDVVHPCVYAFKRDGASKVVIPVRHQAATPTNNRGEYLGMITTLVHLQRYSGADITIVSDSNLCIKTMTDWLPTRKRKGTEAELKNFDLVMIADELLQDLRANNQVRFVHVRSHRKAPVDHLSEAYTHWLINDMADKLATGAIA
jgi:ribonuclease HI